MMATEQLKATRRSRVVAARLRIVIKDRKFYLAENSISSRERLWGKGAESGGPEKPDSSISGFLARHEPCYWQQDQEATMLGRPRRNHTPTFKSKVALAAINKGNKTVAELSQ